MLRHVIARLRRQGRTAVFIELVVVVVGVSARCAPIIAPTSPTRHSAR